MRTYRVRFTANSKKKECVDATVVWQAGRYSGTIKASDPDDAYYKISECYEGANVRKCYPVEDDK